MITGTPGLDLVISGGTVIDGTGAPRRRADVGVAGGRIVAIGDLSVAADGVERVDATGLVVAPGWVDMHSHSDLTLLSDGRARSKIGQGVTTEINGNCGMGGVPLPPAVADLTRKANATIDPDTDVRWDWTDLAGYAAALHREGLALNTAPLLGHIPLRIAVTGEAARPLDARELAAFTASIDAGLDAGAIGVSTGLMYPPAMSADRDELVAIGKAVARHDAVFAIHMRNYSDHLLDAVTEALDIARASGCRLQVSHLAVAGRRNWGAVPRSLELIDARARRGRRCRRRHLSVHRRQREPVPAPPRLGAGRRPRRDRRAARERGAAPGHPRGLARKPVLRVGRDRGVLVRARPRGDTRADRPGCRRRVGEATRTRRRWTSSSAATTASRWSPTAGPKTTCAPS